MLTSSIVRIEECFFLQQTRDDMSTHQSHTWQHEHTSITHVTTWAHINHTRYNM